MPNAQLRVYHASADEPSFSAKPNVRMKLRQLFPILMQAHRYNMGWLKDLGDDEILVTSDVAEIVDEYRSILSDRRA